MIDSGIQMEKNDFPITIRQYYQFRDHLSTIDKVALYKDRIIIPQQLQQDILTALHDAHQGVTSMTARARIRHNEQHREARK